MENTILEISKEDKIKDFIKNNNLTFSGDGSNLNSECTTISGYGLYVGINRYEELEDIVVEINPDVDPDFEEQLRKTFSFAKRNNYENFWKKKSAKTMYKF